MDELAALDRHHAPDRASLQVEEAERRRLHHLCARRVSVKVMSSVCGGASHSVCAVVCAAACVVVCAVRTRYMSPMMGSSWEMTSHSALSTSLCPAVS